MQHHIREPREGCRGTEEHKQGSGLPLPYFVLDLLSLCHGPTVCASLLLYYSHSCWQEAPVVSSVIEQSDLSVLSNQI